MTRWRWQLAQAWGGGGRVVAGSVLALAAAALLHAGATRPLAAALQQEQASHAAQLAQERLQRQAAHGSDPLLAARARLHARLPAGGAAQLNAVLEQIEAAARQQQLEIDSATYQLAPGAPGGIGRYSISIPLKAGYPALRAFIRQALAQSPGLALASITLGRASRSAPQVEARVEFSAHFREAP